MSKLSVIKFLRNCVEYADASIARKEKRGDSEDVIAQWHTYRDFTQHALEEVENGDLDRWFKPEFKKPEIEFRIDDLDHPTRSNWLSAIVSPRPLTLISTRDGVKENIAPITSLSVVSNTPPLLIMSLSQTRDGTKRDTYHNLINSGECELQFLAPTIEAAKDADLAGTPTKESEWNLIDAEGPIHPLAAAVIKCRVVDDRALPEGAVARLITLRAESILVSSDIPPEDGLDILCQHGMDKLTPSPKDWSHLATYHRS